MASFSKKTKKNLVMSKKSSTFAPAFVRKGVKALLGGSRFSRLSGERSGCHSSVGRAKD